MLLDWDANDEVWVTHVPYLDFLSTYGDTREEALECTKEAILLYLEESDVEEIESLGHNPRAELVEVGVAA